MRVDKVTHILLIEDNPADVDLLRYAFDQETSWPTCVTVLNDGEEALSYLARSPQTAPDLIILDLSLPKRDGIEVLRVVRASAEYGRIPVIVFSSSPEAIIESTVLKADLCADCYITKPAALQLVRALPRLFRECYEKSAVKQLKPVAKPTKPQSSLP